MSDPQHVVKVDVVERTTSLLVPDQRVVVSHVGPQGPGGGVTAEDGDARWVNLDGDTMTGALTATDLHADYLTSGYGADMGGHRVTSVADPVDASDAATKAYVDGSSSGGPAAAWAVWGFGQDVERWRLQQPDTALDALDPLVLEGASRHSATRVMLDRRGWYAVTLVGQVDGQADRAMVSVHDSLNLPIGVSAFADPETGGFLGSAVVVLEAGHYAVRASHFGPDADAWFGGQVEFVLLKEDAPVIPVFPWSEGRP
jgi:hypothetical protein